MRARPARPPYCAVRALEALAAGRSTRALGVPLKTFAAFVLTCLATGDCISSGPSFGPVGDVVITKTWTQDAISKSECQDFVFTPQKIKALLERAIIVTRVEEHHSYNVGHCLIRGTATFRGRPATWVYDNGGTGTIEMFDVEFDFADPNVPLSDG